MLSFWLVLLCSCVVVSSGRGSSNLCCGSSMIFLDFLRLSSSSVMIRVRIASSTVASSLVSVSSANFYDVALLFDCFDTSAPSSVSLAPWFVDSSLMMFLHSRSSLAPVLLSSRFSPWSRVLFLDPSSRMSKTAIVSLRMFAKSSLRSTGSLEPSSTDIPNHTLLSPDSSGVPSRGQGKTEKRARTSLRGVQT